MIFIHKIVIGNAPAYLTSKIRLSRENNNGRQTRNASDIRVANALSAFGQNSLFYAGVREFNKIPNEIRQSNKKTFVELLKKFILRHPQ